MSQAIEKDGSVVEALRSRRQVVLDNIRENDETGVNYQKVLFLPVLELVRLSFLIGYKLLLPTLSLGN